MGMEVTSKQFTSAAEALVAEVSESFGDAVRAEVRQHTGGRRKNAYVFMDIDAEVWNRLAKHLKKVHEVDHCSMITGIHWPEHADMTWQVIAHLMRTGVKNPENHEGVAQIHDVDAGTLRGEDIPLEFEITMALGDTRTPSVPSVAKVWKGADWNEKETWDLVGIDFEGHERMRRVLLPHDSPTGYHPLQKQHKLRYHDFNEMYDDPQGFGRKPDDIGKVK